MRTVPSPVAAPRPSSVASGRSRPSVSSLTSPRRSRSGDDTRSAADRSADRLRAGAARSAAARPAAGPRPTGTRPTTPPPATPGADRRPVAGDRTDDALRDRGLLVAAAAAVCAVLALLLLSGVPAGGAVAIGFVPSLAGGWLFLTLVPRGDGGAPSSAATAGGALVLAHVVAAVPVAAAILLAG